VETNNDDTAASASIDDVADCAVRVDAQVRAVLGRVLAQRRSAGVAFGYLSALSPGVRANCWALAEEAGHEGPHRMQALLRTYRRDWKDMRGELAGLAAAWLPCDPGDLIGPGIAIDETAQLKHGDAVSCVAPQHAGMTGEVENCVATVFAAYVTTSGQVWADFDVYMPDRWAWDAERRRAGGIPEDLAMATKPDLAAGQVRRLAAAGMPIGWAAFDEVYTRSGTLREACEQAGLAYAGIAPCDFLITLPSGAVIRADQAVRDAVFERRSCGAGTKGPRLADWALTATASPRHFLLIRRLISRPEQLTFYLCYAPEGRPATMPYFITIAGRRWPAEETLKTGKDVLGWDQCQARAWDAACRHTALSALAQLRQAAVRDALCRLIRLPPAGGASSASGSRGSDTEADIDDADLRIPLSDAPVPAYPGSPARARPA